MAACAPQAALAVRLLPFLLRRSLRNAVETALVLSSFGLFLVPSSAPFNACVSTLALLTVHLCMDRGARWQLCPLYLALLCGCGAASMESAKAMTTVAAEEEEGGEVGEEGEESSDMLLVVMKMAALALTVVALFLCVVFPFALPLEPRVPKGKAGEAGKKGLRPQEIFEVASFEAYVPPKDDVPDVGRQGVMVQVYYPCDSDVVGVRIPSATIAGVLVMILLGDFPQQDDEREGVQALSTWQYLWRIAPLLLMALALAVRDLQLALQHSFPYAPLGTINNRAFAKFAEIPGLLFSHMHLFELRCADSRPLATKHRARPILFTHGLGGTRTCYSAMMTSLAARGHVVIVMEHNDGSAAVTRVPGEEERMYERFPGKPEGEPYRIFRQRQLRRRCYEIKWALEFFKDIATGAPLRNTIIGAPSKKMVDAAAAAAFNSGATQASSSRRSAKKRRGQQPKPQDGDAAQESDDAAAMATATVVEETEMQFEEEGTPGFLRSFAGAVNMQDVTIIGHSFGGATVVHGLLRMADIVHQIGGVAIQRAVLMDAWYFPLDKGLMLKNCVRIPILMFHAKDWMWDTNIALENALAARAESDVLHILLRDSQHHNYSDFALMSPLVSLLMRNIGTVQPISFFDHVATTVTDFADTTGTTERQRHAAARKLPSKSGGNDDDFDPAQSDPVWVTTFPEFEVVRCHRRTATANTSATGTMESKGDNR